MRNASVLSAGAGRKLWGGQHPSPELELAEPEAPPDVELPDVELVEEDDALVELAPTPLELALLA